MSGIENMDFLMNEFPTHELEREHDDRNIQVVLKSGRPRQAMIQNIDGFRSILNTNSKENCHSSL